LFGKSHKLFISGNGLSIARSRDVESRSDFERFSRDCDASNPEDLCQSLHALVNDVAEEVKRVEIILSNELVEYQMITFPPQWLREDERLVLVKNHFTKVYGEQANDWYFAFEGDYKPGERRLACAISGLNFQLDANFEAMLAVKIRSIQPMAVALANLHRKKLKTAWLVVHEFENLVLMYIKKGNVKFVRKLRAKLEGLGDLQRVLRQNRLLSQTIQDDEPVHLYSSAPELFAETIANIAIKSPVKIETVAWLQ